MKSEITDGQELPGVSISADHALPLVIRPSSTETELITWASTYRSAIRDLVHRYGAILLRDFISGSIDTFQLFMYTVSGRPLKYLERSSPRHEVSDGVYTSTDYPPDQQIYLHNEQSYNVTWPMLLFFHCLTVPAAGGGTPLADCRNIYGRISLPVRERLEERKYAYVRCLGTGLGFGWEEAFQTPDRSEVERYCQEHDIEYRWSGSRSLVTRQVRPVSTQHPVTGEWTWFNHLTFFNVSTLDPAVAKVLLNAGKDRLPNNTYYGDGRDIEPETLDELHAAYAAESVVVPWRLGDILMVDNMITAHGREAFMPPREVVVGMCEPYNSSIRS